MSTTDQKHCPSCGTHVNAMARFCKNCAFDFATIPSPEADAATDPTLVTSNPRSQRPLLIAIGIVVVVTIGVLGFWLYKKRTVPSAVVPVASASSMMSQPAVQVENKILSNQSLTDNDTAGLSAQELRILRNVHFARYGRKYERPGLGEYFSTRPWYQPNDGFNENVLTDLDKENIKVIQAAEDRITVAQSRNWDTFWPMLREAVQNKERAKLTRLMPSNFEYDCCALSDENNNGDSRDDAFRWWSKPEVNGWATLNNTLSSGAVDLTAWQSGENRKTKIAPPAANRDRYGDWFALCELREDGRWYFVMFLVPEADHE